MRWKSLLFVAFALAVLAGAWRAYGGAGLALAAGGLVMWLLLHFTRLMHAVKQAADRPIGYVGSAVMLNTKLKARVNLLHVMAITRSLGEQLSPDNAQPELFRWTDPGGSSVTCEFMGGRLVRWTLHRPTQDDAPVPPQTAGGSAGD